MIYADAVDTQIAFEKNGSQIIKKKCKYYEENYCLSNISGRESILVLTPSWVLFYCLLEKV